ncbi:unnamed protein product, partial [Linum tenue]
MGKPMASLLRYEISSNHTGQLKAVPCLYLVLAFNFRATGSRMVERGLCPDLCLSLWLAFE